MTKLQELAILVQKVTDFQQTREQLEKSLEQVDKRIEGLVSQDIPALMDSLGMSKITTQDGWDIELEESYHGSISEKNEAAAYDWMEKNGYGPLIKNTVFVEYDSEDHADAVALFHDLNSKQLPVSLTKKIHHRTLKKFIRERMEEKDDGFPNDVFGVYHKRTAQLKRKK